MKELSLNEKVDLIKRQVTKSLSYSIWDRKNSSATDIKEESRFIPSFRGKHRW